MSSNQIFFNHKLLWQHLEDCKSCFVEMELKIPPAYEWYFGKKLFYIHLPSKNIYAFLIEIHDQFFFEKLNDDFVEKRINSCEDPSRYNVKRLYIYAKEMIGKMKIS